jgi:hypothetical protein
VSLTLHGASVQHAKFENPQRITILGYTGAAMEPFISRDGKHLFFNNSSDPKVNPNLHSAERGDDLTFQYKGEIEGVNTPALEGVASVDRDSNFYFISPKSYEQTASTPLNDAPSTSVSELELFFTRLDASGPAIYMAHRSAASLPFEVPTKIHTIDRFVEAPTLSPDENSLYYHKAEGNRFVIYRVTRGMTGKVTSVRQRMDRKWRAPRPD